MSEWQPIDTAPKDGRTVIVYQPGYSWRYPSPRHAEEVAIAYWRQPGNPERAPEWIWGTRIYRPTHWMPLPSPPAPPESR